MWLASPLVEIGFGMFTIAVALGMLLTGGSAAKPGLASSPSKPGSERPPPIERQGLAEEVAPPRSREPQIAETSFTPATPAPQPHAASYSRGGWTGFAAASYRFKFGERPGPRDDLAADAQVSSPPEPAPLTQPPPARDPPQIKSIPSELVSPVVGTPPLAETRAEGPPRGAIVPQPGVEAGGPAKSLQGPPAEAQSAEAQSAEAQSAEILADWTQTDQKLSEPPEDALKRWIDEALPKTSKPRSAATIWRNVLAKTPAAVRSTPEGAAARLSAAFDVLGKLAPEVFALPSTREALGAIARSENLELIWPGENETFDPSRHQSVVGTEGPIHAVVRPGLSADDKVRLKASVSRLKTV